MTILLLLFVIYIISTLRTKKDDTFLSKSQTRTINGIMSYLIFMSHFIQYIDNKDFIYNRFQSYMGQLVVAPFLAFSGYGIMLSIEKKGKPYIVSLIKKRFVNIWLRFAGIVLLFLVVDQFTGNQYPLSTILLSFVAWESIGNSNWYVLAILILYVITYISFIKIPPSKYIYSIATLTFFCLLYALILRQAGKGSWYYDTIIAYPIGMLISYYRDQIMRICDKKRPFIFLTTSSIIIFTIITLLNLNIAFFEIRVVLFVVLIIFFSHILCFKSKILEWLGDYAFEFFLLARIPFIIFKTMPLNMYVYFIISLIVTIGLCIAYRCAFEKINSYISSITSVKR